MLPRILPFALYLFFLVFAQGIAWLADHVPAVAVWETWAFLWLYPIKIAAVSGALLFFWPAYQELKGTPLSPARDVLLAVGVGVAMYLVWISVTWPWATQGQPTAYNPFLAGTGTGPTLAAIRLLGAAVVVPIMEELFWRSFLLRYLVSPCFDAVPLGTFTLFSFIATIVLFGLEHHLWLAGMLAGLAYTLLLYRTRQLWPSIIAHGVTNLALGIHVLVTGEWILW